MSDWAYESIRHLSILGWHSRSEAFPELSVPLVLLCDFLFLRVLHGEIPIPKSIHKEIQADCIAAERMSHKICPESNVRNSPPSEPDQFSEELPHSDSPYMVIHDLFLMTPVAPFGCPHRENKSQTGYSLRLRQIPQATSSAMCLYTFPNCRMRISTNPAIARLKSSEWLDQHRRER
jgi:hypothetical protein